MMRILLLLGAVLLAIWAWRSARGDAPRAKGPPASPKVQDMASCAHCGVHFPRGEGVPGRKGLYCGLEHQRAAEKG